MEDRLSELAVRCAEALGASPDASRLSALVRFGGLVATWNRKVNLTGAKEPEPLAEVLYADAMVLADGELVPEGARVVDVGSGAGLPAIPLAILRPDLDLTLVEPLRKRVTFIRSALGASGLADRVRVVEGKVDPAAPSVAGGPFDLAMSRATLAPPDWLRVGLALAPRALVMTGKESPPPAPETATVACTRRYALPFTASPRTITAYARR